MSAKTVFISYRRDSVGKPFARSLEQALTQRGYDVFLDVDTVDAGDWAEQILTEVPNRAHFLLLLTPGALERCADDGNWMRREYETAAKHDRNIVPVLEESLSVGDLRTSSPDCMRTVFDLQIASLRHGSYAADIDALVERFIPPHKAPPDDAIAAIPDYTFAGLPIQRFDLPDPPTHELELLHAKQCAVDLVGRDADLDALWQWLRTGENISARLIIGRAGTGKTRLAFELLLRVNAELPEWQAGLLTGSVVRKFDATKQPADWMWPASTLLVVDYAQTLAAPLGEILRALTHRRRAANLPPLRLLLLEREPGDWFDALLRDEDSGGPCAVRRLFDPPTPVPLTRLPEGQLRRKILTQTLDKVSKLTGKPAPPFPPDGAVDYEASLKRDIFAEPLNLMLAALAAGELGLLPALTRSRIELAEVLAEKELRRLRRFARHPGNAAQEQAICHLAACATMERGFTSQELDRAVAEELAALNIDWPDGPGDLATALRSALPSSSLAVAAIEPDFVGEALVLSALAKSTTRNEPDRWRTWCSTVERCCRRDSRATPATLLHAFQNFGNRPEFGKPLLAATDALIRAGMADAEPELLVGIEIAMPHHTAELRKRAADVTSHLYERLKSALDNGRIELKSEVARVANNLGMRLSSAGTRAEAVGPAQVAVDLFRTLSHENPRAFQPRLAIALSNLANALSEAGHLTEAPAPAQEAVKTLRTLVDHTSENHSAELYQAALAESLNNLAGVWSSMCRHAEAVAAAQEAAKISRNLVRNRPGAFESVLAMALGNLASFLSMSGKQTSALEPAREAVDLHTALARTNPDAFEPLLAMARNNLGNVLSELGQPAEALDWSKKAVELYRKLAQQNPSAFQTDLAGALSNQAARFSETNQWIEALLSAEEAVDLYRAPASQNADVFGPDFAKSLAALGLALEGNQRGNEALGRIAEAIGTLMPHFKRIPDAHAAGMVLLVRFYLRLVKILNHPRDDALLDPVVEVFKQLEGKSPPTS